MTKEQMLEMLKDPDVAKELKKQSEGELNELLKEVKITDDTTMDDLSKSYMKKLEGLTKYFNTKLDEVEKSAVEKARQPEADKETAKIQAFSKKNPAMANPDVVALMQPLYDKGMSLEDAYAKACKIEEVNPVSGKSLEEDPIKADDKKAKRGEKKEEKAPKSSKKSEVTDDDEEELEEEEIKVDEDKPLDLDAVLATASNNYEAKTGKTPFA